MLSWILLASIPVIAVVLRLFAGDDAPDNGLYQVQDGTQEEDDPDALLIAA